MNKAIMVFLIMMVSACVSEARGSSMSVLTDEPRFRLNQHIVFYNVLTDQYMLSIVGRCDVIDIPEFDRVKVTCKNGVNSFKEMVFNLSDNIVYFTETIDINEHDEYRFRMNHRPTNVANLAW